METPYLYLDYYIPNAVQGTRKRRTNTLFASWIVSCKRYSRAAAAAAAATGCRRPCTTPARYLADYEARRPKEYAGPTPNVDTRPHSSKDYVQDAAASTPTEDQSVRLADSPPRKWGFWKTVRWHIWDNPDKPEHENKFLLKPDAYLLSYTCLGYSRASSTSPCKRPGRRRGCPASTTRGSRTSCPTISRCEGF